MQLGSNMPPSGGSDATNSVSLALQHGLHFFKSGTLRVGLLSVLVLNTKSVNDFPHCLVLPLLKKFANLIALEGNFGPILKSLPRGRGRFATNLVVLVPWQWGSLGGLTSLETYPWRQDPLSSRKTGECFGILRESSLTHLAPTARSLWTIQ